jgi:hypothetical protein
MQYFLERFKGKTKEELEVIVASFETYDRRAVLAAVEIMRNKFKQQVPSPIKTQKSIPYKSEHDSYKFYIKTFSYREVLTSISLAFLFIAFLNLIRYYRNEDWVENNFSLLYSTFFMLMLPLNHIFYKIEHKRRNLVIGRLMQVTLTVMLCFVVMKVQDFVRGYSTSFDGTDILQFTFASIFVALFAEFIISLVRRLLTLFKWQIW